MSPIQHCRVFVVDGTSSRGAGTSTRRGGAPVPEDPNGSQQKPEERRSPARGRVPEPRDVFSQWAPSSQRVGPIPNTGPTNSHARTHLSPQLIRTLLNRGGVELNPGPRHPCWIFGDGVGSGSYKCSGCHYWIHGRCSLLPNRRAYPGEFSWLCPGCQNPNPPPFSDWQDTPGSIS